MRLSKIYGSLKVPRGEVKDLGVEPKMVPFVLSSSRAGTLVYAPMAFYPSTCPALIKQETQEREDRRETWAGSK